MTSNTDDREARIDAIVATYADRIAQDEAPRRGELLDANPDLRDDLERCFAMVDGPDAGLPAMTPIVPLAPGAVLGDFELVREIGRGGMGVVYEAEQRGIGRRVALKILRAHLTEDSRHVERFRREGRAIGAVQHPAVVTVHAIGEAGGHLYIAMDLVGERTLADVIGELAARNERPTAADLAEATGDSGMRNCGSYAEAATRFLLPVLDGLSAAHDAGVLHRDIKPSNILIDADGAPQVADFGLARGAGDAGLSLTGEPLGTPYYMSPEQARAASRGMDARTDVYSAGVTLFELLALRVPYPGESAVDVIRKILSNDPPELRTFAGDVTADLEAVVMKTLTRDRDGRYATMAEFATDLENALTGRPVDAPRPSEWGAFLSALAGGLIPGSSPREYRSLRSIGGMPLVHVAFGADPETGNARVARGVLAIGNAAVGVFAFGGAATGIFAFGGMSLGLVSAFGGMALGGVAVGGLAAGVVAVGGFAAGLIALGGFSMGWVASGGFAMGTHVYGGGVFDPYAENILRTYFPWWLKAFG